MNAKESIIFELESMLCLWEKEYRLAGTESRVIAIKKAIELLKKEKDEVC